MRLGSAEIEILKMLAREKTPNVSSFHRLRLEMLGLATDSAKGLRLTQAGHRAAASAVPTEHEKADTQPRHFDAAGRKRMLERRLQFVA